MFREESLASLAERRANGQSKPKVPTLEIKTEAVEQPIVEKSKQPTNKAKEKTKKQVAGENTMPPLPDFKSLSKEEQMANSFIYQPIYQN